MQRLIKKYLIPIQSFSDVVTNSSSEIFCTIIGRDLEAIYELLEPLFNSDDSEIAPTIEMCDNHIEIWVPYGDFPREFYEAGLEAVLDKYFKDNYNIEYE